MIVPLIFISFLVIYMIWDIKFSRASTILGALKAREPRTVASLEGWLPPLPSVLLGRSRINHVEEHPEIDSDLGSLLRDDEVAIIANEIV
jgi:hypothetical protein